jgi:hypothetical protein
VGLLVAGCATYVWERPATPATVMEQDRQECDDLARRLAVDYDMRAGGPWPMSPYGADPFYWPMGFETSLAFERRVAQRCMESKGYRLIKQAPRPDAGG